MSFSQLKEDIDVVHKKSNGAFSDEQKATLLEVIDSMGTLSCSICHTKGHEAGYCPLNRQAYNMTRGDE